MTLEALQSLYHRPFFELVHQAHEVTQENWPANEVQLCSLLSIKTGGCSEDCGYCAQSARYSTGVAPERLMSCEAVMERARAARAIGATRFCMGAAWKGVRSGDRRFNEVLQTIREVSKLGMEVCVTLGQLGDDEARQLKEAGVTAYNHNVDTSEDFYPEIVSTHTYQDRLDTIAAVQRAGMAVCCGGILGLGETLDDRLKMLQTLLQLDPPPESIPINMLMPMPGTPLAEKGGVQTFDLIRMIAVTRLLFPKAKVRLSAGRTGLSEETQAWCLYAGANSIFYGDKLLTAKNPSVEKDLRLLKELGMRPQAPFTDQAMPACSESASLESASVS